MSELQDAIGEVTEGLEADSVDLDQLDGDAGDENVSVSEMIQRAVDQLGEEEADTDADAAADADADADASPPSTTFKRLALEVEGLEDASVLEQAKFKVKMGGEVKELSLEQLVREAQQAAGVQKVLRQRDETAKELDKASEELDRLRAVERTFAQALADEEYLNKVREEVSKQTGQPLGQASTQGQAQPKGPTPEQIAQAANQIMETGLRPHLSAVADAYGADAKELEAVMMDMAGQINPRFFQPEDLEEILNVQLVDELEKAGYRATKEIQPFSVSTLGRRFGSAASRPALTPKASRDERVAELEAELQRLKEGQVVNEMPGEQASSAALETPQKKGGKVLKTDRQGNLVVDEDASFSEVQRQLRKLQGYG